MYQAQKWHPIGIAMTGGYINLEMSRYKYNGFDHLSLARDVPLVGNVGVLHESGLGRIVDELSNQYDGEVGGLINTEEGIVLVPKNSFNTFCKPFGKYDGYTTLAAPSGRIETLEDARVFVEWNHLARTLSVMLQIMKDCQIPGYLFSVAEGSNGELAYRCPLTEDPHAMEAHTLTPNSVGRMVAEYEENMSALFGNPLAIAHTLSQLPDSSHYVVPASQELVRKLVKGDSSILPNDCCGVIVIFYENEQRAIFIPAAVSKAPDLMTSIASVFKFNHNGRVYWNKPGTGELKSYLLFRKLRLEGKASIGVPLSACMGVRSRFGRNLAVSAVFPDVVDYLGSDFEPGKANPDQSRPPMLAAAARIQRDTGIVPNDLNGGNYFFNPKTKAVEFIDFEGWQFGNISF